MVLPCLQENFYIHRALDSQKSSVFPESHLPLLSVVHTLRKMGALQVSCFQVFQDLFSLLGKLFFHCRMNLCDPISRSLCYEAFMFSSKQGDLSRVSFFPYCVPTGRGVHFIIIPHTLHFSYLWWSLHGILEAGTKSYLSLDLQYFIQNWHILGDW